MVWGILAKVATSAIAKFGGTALAKSLGRTVVSGVTKIAAKTGAAPAIKGVVARIPARTAVTGALRAAVGIPVTPAAAVAAKAVVPRPVATLAAVAKKQVAALIEKPFRTALPYAATAGMLGAVSRFGEEKVESTVGKGALVGTAITAPTSLLPTGLGGTPRMGGVGGVPMVTPEIVRHWSTGTTEFIVDSTGKHWVLTRSGWKRYSPKKPIVLGTKHLTPKKFIQAAKKYYALKKDLDKVFKTVKKKK